jgi:hypothetical protein
VSVRDVCARGYSVGGAAVPQRTERRVLARYGLSATAASVGDYQIDRLIPFGLGGGDGVANVWPQPARPAPGYHEKDRLETALRRQVCLGMLSLGAAQRQFARSWLAAYHRIYG